ncbi:MAG: PEP-utilizing enzyme, partial [Phycisphaeraceae bacterium]
MQSRRGIPVSPGVAIAKAVVLDHDEQTVAKRHVAKDQLKAEHDLVDAAIADALADLEDLRGQTASVLGSQLADIFGFHAGLLKDQAIVSRFHAVIDSEMVTGAYAVFSVMQDLADQFLAQDNAFFRERVSDIYDLKRRLLTELVGEQRSALSGLDRPAIVVAHDLTPSQTAALDRKLIRGLATDLGGRTSHTAILAHALGIPAVVGLKDITRRAATGDTIILDGHRGHAILQPDAAQLLESRQEARAYREEEKALKKLDNGDDKGDVDKAIKEIGKATKELLPVEARVGDRVAAEAQQRGLIIRPVGHLNIISPPLIWDHDTVDRVV